MHKVMVKKTILLIEDNAKVETLVRESLQDYEVWAVPGLEEAEKLIRGSAPSLIVVDYDLKPLDGLQVFRRLYPLIPQVKFILLSNANNIPLAVSAAKLGIADFLKKPVEPEQLRLSVEKNSVSPPNAPMLGTISVPWLRGNSLAAKKVYAEIEKALYAASGIILSGERGINKREVAQFIHSRGRNKNRRLVAIDLASFRKENQEASFWTTIQEVMSLPQPGALSNEEDRCGTLYLENIEFLEEGFRLSVLDFFRERRNKIDKGIFVVIAVPGAEAFSQSQIKGYVQIEIPPLSARKEDLPGLIGHYIKKYSIKHNKKNRALSLEALEFLASYDFPGNYIELENILEQAVLLASSCVIELRDLSFNFKSCLEASLGQFSAQGKFPFGQARQSFEKNLYRIILDKTAGDFSSAARFLDLPKNSLVERIEDLRNDLPD